MATGLPPRVRQLGWISFWADVASEMAYPVLPLFIAHTLKAPAMALGAVEGAAEALVSFMKGWSGWHSDRRGERVPYVRWGYGLSAFGKPLLALAVVWPMLFLGRLLDRFGKGLRTSARDALLAESVDPTDYGRAFGYHRAMDTAGAFVGVAVALAMLALLPGQYRMIFVAALVPGAISLALTFRVKEGNSKVGTVPPDRSDSDEVEPVSPAKEGRPGGSFSTAYWRIVALHLLFAIANSSDTFLLLRARDLGLADAAVILAYAAYNVVFALASYPAGRLSDRVGRWPVLALGWGLYGATYLGFAQVGAAWIWPLFALYGLYMGLTKAVGTALVAEAAPRDRLGTAMGLFAMLSGFATLAASLLTGWLWDRSGAEVAFVVSAGIAFAALAAIPVTARIGRMPKALA